eukprot:Gb_33068 [translate_table: standard]
MNALRQVNTHIFRSGIGSVLKEPCDQPGIPLDFTTCASLLQACTDIKSLMQVHAQMFISGLNRNMFLCTGLLSAYANCGSMENARMLFDKTSNRDVVLWNVMIRGYSINGHCKKSLTLYSQMQCAGIQPDNFTFPLVLKACAGLSALQAGKEVHDHVVRTGFELEVIVGNSLVAMYAKCGSIQDAYHVFDKMPRRNVVSWNAMIWGYAQNGHSSKALTLFNQMQIANLKPNRATIVSVLPACADLAALQQGKDIHDYIIRNGFELEVTVQNALIDMYAKCGCIQIARQLFDKISKRSVVSWSAIIAGYGMHGQAEDALVLFSQMQQTGIQPDHITFVSVLSACSHAGLVDEGLRYFDCMIRDYCIAPRQEHYACMVDLLGRAGRLGEAQEFIEKLPLEPGVTVWGALLGACRIHCNIDLGKHAAEHLFKLDPKNAGHYVQLSNIYAAAGRWNDAAKVRTTMENRGLKKTAGCSSIEVNNRVHAFLMDDRSHPQSEKIYATIEALTGLMKAAGYVPDTNYMLHDAEEKVNEMKL